MTLPASGAISMSAINTELGLSATSQISLNDTAARTLAGVPSGQIDLDDFWGKSSVTISLPSTINGGDFAISPTDAVATMTLSSAGSWTCTSGGSGNWMTGGGTASNYEARMTTVSGTLSSGSGTGTWLGLGTTRSWTRNESRNGYFTSTYVGTLEIRLAASPFTVLTTSTVTLESTVEV